MAESPKRPTNDSRDAASRVVKPGKPAVPTNQTARAADSTPLATGPFTVLPTQFGRYQVEKLLGKGAMGAVYLAHDIQLDRPIALKVASDLYALGLMLFEMLTGEWPFAGTAIEVMGRKCAQAPPSSLDINPSLSIELAAVCSRIISKNKEDRYASCADLIAALSAANLESALLTVGPERSPWLKKTKTFVSGFRLNVIRAMHTPRGLKILESRDVTFDPAAEYDCRPDRERRIGGGQAHGRVAGTFECACCRRGRIPGRHTGFNSGLASLASRIQAA